MILYPTHTCFDDALDMLVDAVLANPGADISDELKLVHAICVALDGHEYSHAWVESDGKFCWFMAILNGERTQFVAYLDEFYKEYRVKETIKYTPHQAAQMNCRFVTFGPWEDRLIALCRNAKVETKPKG